jgi:pyridoxine 5-phosphate synthase
MPALSVNLNKVALLRNSRTIGIPSVVDAARTCIAAGADGITVHPRPDGRHIRREDVFALGEVVGAVEYNIEGNPVPEFMRLVREIRPTQCTLVPDSPAQLTSDHGWDLKREAARLAPLVAELRDLGVRVAIFMDPDLEQIALAPQVGADRIELYTEPYAAAFDTARREPVLCGYRAAAARAQELGLGVNAGHDLNLRNLPLFCAAVSGVLECSIGHALIADALWLGLAETVRRYRLACAG